MKAFAFLIFDKFYIIFSHFYIETQVNFLGKNQHVSFVSTHLSQVGTSLGYLLIPKHAPTAVIEIKKKNLQT